MSAMQSFEAYRATLADRISQPLPPSASFKESLGRWTWGLLHDAADNYPCAECQPDFALLVSGMHDTVNRKLGKPVHDKATYDQFRLFVAAPGTHRVIGNTTEAECNTCGVPVAAANAAPFDFETPQVELEPKPESSLSRSDILASVLWGGVLSLTVIGMARAMESKFTPKPDAPMIFNPGVAIPLVAAIGAAAFAMFADNFALKTRTQAAVASVGCFAYLVARLT